MSKVQENILTRRTIFRFSDKLVSKDCIETAIEAARHAPCHKNTHPWKFYIMGNEARKKLIPIVETLAKAKADSEDQQKLEAFSEGTLAQYHLYHLYVQQTRTKLKELPKGSKQW